MCPASAAGLNRQPARDFFYLYICQANARGVRP